MSNRSSSRIAVAVVVLAASAVVTDAFAQKALQPLPDIPPPPKLENSTAPDDEAPQVTIRQEADSKVEEFRTKSGKLYAIRVTPRIGKPYLLIDPDGKGTMTNAGEINGGVKPPQWTIFEF